MWAVIAFCFTYTILLVEFPFLQRLNCPKGAMIVSASYSSGVSVLATMIFMIGTEKVYVDAQAEFPISIDS